MEQNEQIDIPIFGLDHTFPIGMASKKLGGFSVRELTEGMKKIKFQIPKRCSTDIDKALSQHLGQRSKKWWEFDFNINIKL